MIFTMAAFLTPRAVEARTYYVATSGNDNHSGTEAQPLRTTQKAASLARCTNGRGEHSSTMFGPW